MKLYVVGSDVSRPFQQVFLSIPALPCFVGATPGAINQRQYFKMSCRVLFQHVSALVLPPTLQLSFAALVFLFTSYSPLDTWGRDSYSIMNEGVFSAGPFISAAAGEFSCQPHSPHTFMNLLCVYIFSTHPT